MSKVSKRYINQIKKVWYDLFYEATQAMSYVDDENDGDEQYLKVLDRLDDRFCKAIAHLEE